MLQGIIDLLDGRRIVPLRINQLFQLFRNLGAEPVGFFAVFDDALRLTPLDIQKDP